MIMKSQTTLRMLMFLLGMFTFGITVKGQNPTYKLTISNETMIDASTYQFDVYLQRTGSTALELANFACGIAYDASILNGGTPTCSQVSGYSQLSASQVPTTTSTVPAANCARISLLSLAELNRDKPATFSGNPA